MRWKPYITAIIVILALRFIDLYVTHKYTPDLKNEWNPLISILGISWPIYILTQILIVAFIALLMFFYFNREPLEMDESDLSYNDFVYVYFFGKLQPWKERILWAFDKPTHLKRHLVFSGFLAMLATIFISIFAIANNLLLIAEVDGYIRFVSRYYNAYFSICFITVTMLSLYLYFAIEYYKYRRMQYTPAFSDKSL